jgi:hypothetical protein
VSCDKNIKTGKIVKSWVKIAEGGRKFAKYD